MYTDKPKDKQSYYRMNSARAYQLQNDEPNQRSVHHACTYKAISAYSNLPTLFIDR